MRVDVNPAMLIVARELTAQPPVPIQWELARADTQPLPDGRVDAVACQQTIHFSPTPAPRCARIAPSRFPSAAFLSAETSSSPLGDLAPTLDTLVPEALLDDLAAKLAPHTDDAGVVFPFATVVLTAGGP